MTKMKQTSFKQASLPAPITCPTQQASRQRLFWLLEIYVLTESRAECVHLPTSACPTPRCKDSTFSMSGMRIAKKDLRGAKWLMEDGNLAKHRRSLGHRTLGNSLHTCKGQLRPFLEHGGQVSLRAANKLAFQRVSAG